MFGLWWTFKSKTCILYKIVYKTKTSFARLKYSGAHENLWQQKWWLEFSRGATFFSEMRKWKRSLQNLRHSESNKSSNVITKVFWSVNSCSLWCGYFAWLRRKSVNKSILTTICWIQIYGRVILTLLLFSQLNNRITLIASWW